MCFRKPSYLGISLTKEVKENYKILLKGMKEDMREWKHIPCSSAGRINIKITTLSKAFYIQWSLGKDTYAWYFSKKQCFILLKFIWINTTHTWSCVLSALPLPKAKAILEGKKMRGIVFSNFKLCPKVVVLLKIEWFWNKCKLSD